MSEELSKEKKKAILKGMQDLMVGQGRRFRELEEAVRKAIIIEDLKEEARDE